MSAEDTSRFHEATKHHPGRMWAGGGRMDPTNRPASWKRYPDAAVIPLPPELPGVSVPATEVLSGRIPPTATGIDLDGLARLLFFSAGVTRRWDVGGQTFNFRAAPSAGALYPIEVYVACADVPGLPAGLYHFEPVGYVLQRLRDDDVRAAVADAAAWSKAAAAPCTLLLTGIPWRTAWKYGLRGYRHLFWDAGTILAHLLALADAAGQPAAVLSGFDDNALTELLGMEGDEAAATGGELPLALVPIGQPGAEPAPASEVHPLRLDVEPLSRAPEQIDDVMVAVHREAGLSGTDEVERWRSAVHASARHIATDSPVPPESGEPLESVILRRGSTRRFARRPVAKGSLMWALGAAASPVAVDALAGRGTLLDHHIAVHAVEEFSGGAYRWAGDSLDGPQPPASMARLGDLDRSVTAHLCLDQPHGGDAAYTVFHSADLDGVLDRAGARGYRVAQLEAGIRSGRLQLAAFASGVGATGLTFYDDEVRRRFGTRSEPMTVTAVGPPAYRPRPGSLPRP